MLFESKAKRKIMQILFIDESYNMRSSVPFFVLGGIVIPETLWFKCKALIESLKNTQQIEGEIKWKWVFNTKDKRNTMSHLSIESRKDKIVKPILEFIRDNNLQIFTTLTYLNDYKSDFINSEKIEEKSPVFNHKFECFYYGKNYENIVQRFQYYLQDLSSENKGIIICDGRNNKEDDILREVHKNMLYGTKGKRTINYNNLIEHVLIAPSHFSIGVQFADIIAGIIYNRLRKNTNTQYLFEIIKNNFNKQNGKTSAEGRGIVKLPKNSTFWEK